MGMPASPQILCGASYCQSSHLPCTGRRNSWKRYMSFHCRTPHTGAEGWCSCGTWTFCRNCSCPNTSPKSPSCSSRQRQLSQRDGKSNAWWIYVWLTTAVGVAGLALPSSGARTSLAPAAGNSTSAGTCPGQGSSSTLLGAAWPGCPGGPQTIHS